MNIGSISAFKPLEEPESRKNTIINVISKCSVSQITERVHIEHPDNKIEQGELAWRSFTRASDKVGTWLPHVCSETERNHLHFKKDHPEV